MDFHTLSRKDLQALCKKNRIPANTTNVAMADALQALQSVQGIAEIQGSMMLQSPKTNQKTTTIKSKNEDQASPLPRSRRVSARPPVMDDEEKEVASETPSLVNTRRRVSKKEESKSVLGTTVARKTRQTVKKEVGSEMVSTGLRRSTRAKGIKMSPLSKEEDEEKELEAEKLEANDEEKLDEKELKTDVEAEEKLDENELKAALDADVQLEAIEEKAVEAEIMVIQSRKGENMDEKELEGEEVTDQVEFKEGKVVEADIMALQFKDLTEAKEQNVEAEIIVCNIDENEQGLEEVEDHADPKEAIAAETEIIVLQLQSTENDNADEKEPNEEEFEDQAEPKEDIVLQSETIISRENGHVNGKEQEEECNDVENLALQSKDVIINEKEQEEKGEVQPDTREENDHVEETLVEDQAIHMETNQEERISSKPVTVCAKIMTEEFNSLDNINHADKEKHETVENKEETIDLEAKQGEMIEFKTEEESAKIVIEEMNSWGISEYTVEDEIAEEEAIDEGKQETVADHVEGTAVENKEVTTEFETVLEGAKIVKEELNSSDHTDKDDNIIVEDEAIHEEKQKTDHVEETLVEIKKEADATDFKIWTNEMNSLGNSVLETNSNIIIVNQKLNAEIKSEEGKNIEVPTDKACEVVVDMIFADNKENEDMIFADMKMTKSNVMANYENLSLRKLKSAYKEMMAMKNKGEEKRTALKTVNENCM